MNAQLAALDGLLAGLPDRLAARFPGVENFELLKETPAVVLTIHRQ